MVGLPLGSIVPWFQNPPGNMDPSPNGEWVICDGRSLPEGTHEMEPNVPSTGAFVTPNLINAYIIGAEPSYAFGVAGGAVGAANDEASAPGPHGAVGTNEVSLVINNIPQHTHTLSTDGNHSHDGTTATAPNHTHGFTTNQHSHRSTSVGKPYIFDPDNGQYPDIRFAGSGTKNFRIAPGDNPQTGLQDVSGTTSAAGGHTHTYTTDSAGGHTHTVGNTGADPVTAVDNRPRSYGMVWIMKVKR